MSPRLSYETMFLDLIKDADREIDTSKNNWWYDLRPQGGLRLTVWAYEILTQLAVEYYEFELSRELSKRPKFLLDLDRKITCPYFLQTKPVRILLFGSRTAVMCSLYNDVEQFLQNASPRSGQ